MSSDGTYPAAVLDELRARADEEDLRDRDNAEMLTTLTGVVERLCSEIGLLHERVDRLERQSRERR